MIAHLEQRVNTIPVSFNEIVAVEQRYDLRPMEVIVSDRRPEQNLYPAEGEALLDTANAP